MELFPRQPDTRDQRRDYHYQSWSWSSTWRERTFESQEWEGDWSLRQRIQKRRKRKASSRVKGTDCSIIKVWERGLRSWKLSLSKICIFLRAQNINSFDLQIRMYIVVFINFWHFYQVFHFFFVSWKLECWISCPFTCPYLPSQLKIPLPLYPRVQKTGGIFTALDCWAVAQGDTGEKSLKHVAWMYPWTSPHSWAIHPQPFTCSHKACQMQWVYALTRVLFFSHLQCSLCYFPCDFIQWLGREHEGGMGRTSSSSFPHVSPWHGHTQG